MITTSDDALAGRPRVRMSDERIADELGPLIWDALVAFGEDPGFFTSMVESANLTDLRKAAWAKNHPRPGQPAEDTR